MAGPARIRWLGLNVDLAIVAWAIGQSVTVGDLRSHNGKVWKAKVAHVTHAGWEPSAAAWAVWEEQV